MSVNSCGDSVLSDLQLREQALRSRQPSDLPELARFAAQEKARKSDADAHSNSGNSGADREMQSSAPQMTAAFSRKNIPCNDMQGMEEPRDAQKSKKKSEQFYAASTLVRWCKFNFVGAIGIAVQFAVLIFLKSALHMNYLLATAIAVEAAVVHNFVWHEQFTWADRFLPRTRPARFLRFNFANGGVSIVGNLTLMKLMVGLGHMNYIAANAIAIALCSLANFLVSDQWVFEKDGVRETEC
jgi:putative flippase GtrA